MKNTIFISMILIFLSGCSTSNTNLPGGNSLLEFVDLATEMSVDYEESDVATSRAPIPRGNSTD